MTIMQESDPKSGNINPAFLKSTQIRPPRMIGVKIAIFFAFILSLASLGAAAYLYQNLQVERQGRVALEAAKIQLEDQAEALQRENEKSNGEIANLQEQLKGHAAERDEWKRQMDQIQADNVSLQDKINELEASRQNLETNLNAAPIGAVPSGVAGAAAGAVPAVQPAAVPVPETAAAKPDQAAAAAKSFQVMTVNRKFNFVVISLVPQTPLKMGDKLQVERKGKNTGSVQVEKLYDNFAAAAILEESKESPIKEGDGLRKI